MIQDNPRPKSSAAELTLDSPGYEDASLFAKTMLQELKDGEFCLDDSNSSTGLQRSALRYASIDYIHDAEDQWGVDALETIKEIFPSWSVDRIVSLIRDKVTLSDEELAEVGDHILDGDDELRFTVYVGVFPVPAENPKGWAVISESGIALDREFGLDGIFASREAAEAYVEQEYGF